MVRQDEDGTVTAITGPHTAVVPWITLRIGVQAEARPGSLKMTRGLSCKARAADRLGVSRRLSADKILKLIEAKISAVKVAADAESAVTGQ